MKRITALALLAAAVALVAAARAYDLYPVTDFPPGHPTVFFDLDNRTKSCVHVAFYTLRRGNYIVHSRFNRPPQDVGPLNLQAGHGYGFKVPRTNDIIMEVKAIARDCTMKSGFSGLEQRFENGNTLPNALQYEVTGTYPDVVLRRKR